MVDPIVLVGSRKLHSTKPDRAAVDASAQSGAYLQGWPKRIFDLVTVCLVAPIALSVIAVLCVAIMATSRGSPIFVQERYGRGKEVFRILKLRTMRSQPRSATFRQANKDDDRCTSVGRLLRKTSLDEVPQLWCVLRGDMSIVGPRPHPTALDDEYSPQIDGYDRRFKARPGITGLAQISGARGETPTVEHMQRRIDFDNQYVDTASLSNDLRILVGTVKSVLLARDAY